MRYGTFHAPNVPLLTDDTIFAGLPICGHCGDAIAATARAVVFIDGRLLRADPPLLLCGPCDAAVVPHTLAGCR